MDSRVCVVWCFLVGLHWEIFAYAIIQDRTQANIHINRWWPTFFSNYSNVFSTLKIISFRNSLLTSWLFNSAEVFLFRMLPLSIFPMLHVLPISELLFPATRESAFVHAIASAGVAFAVTRACAEGSATICGCDTRHKGPPGEGWKWGGCSEDVEFGSMVSREFADARENRPDARSAMNRHNNEAGRMVREKLFLLIVL